MTDTLLTGDAGLIARAKAFGIDVVSLANRGWELPAEKSTVEKQLEKIRRENEDLKRAGPQIVCDLYIGEDAIEEIRLETVRQPPLTPELVEELLAEVRARHPRVDDFSLPTDSQEEPSVSYEASDLANYMEPVEWRAPTAEKIDIYHRLYDAWFDELAEFIRETPGKLDETTIKVDLYLELWNDGNEPADSVQLSIGVTEGFLISEIPDEVDEQEAETKKDVPARPTKFRSPPSPPQPVKVIKPSSGALNKGSTTTPSWLLADQERILGISGLSDAFPEITRIAQYQKELNLLGDPFRQEFERLTSSARIAFTDPWESIDPEVILPSMPEPWNPQGFYRRDTPRRSGDRSWSLECDELRHRIDPKEFGVRLTAAIEDEQPSGGAIRVQLSARNMRQPFEKTFPIRVRVIKADVQSALRELLP